MKLIIQIPLNTNAQQHARLDALQVAFAQVCNVLAPVARETRVWNRVALHHLMYHKLREQFPAMGSQMVCNAIYSVSRTCRQIYQHPDSPFNKAALGARSLPLLRFADTCPVYFDRHTLSLKAGQLSLYTLDGRMHFRAELRPEDEVAFHSRKLREIILARRADGGFMLSFWFAEEETADAVQQPPMPVIPEYVSIEEAA